MEGHGDPWRTGSGGRLAAGVIGVQLKHKSDSYEREALVFELRSDHARPGEAGPPDPVSLIRGLSVAPWDLRASVGDPTSVDSRSHMQ